MPSQYTLLYFLSCYTNVQGADRPISSIRWGHLVSGWWKIAVRMHQVVDCWSMFGIILLQVEWRVNMPNDGNENTCKVAISNDPYVCLVPVMITCYFLSFSTIYLCLLFVSQPVDCSSPIYCVPYFHLILSSWSQNYPFNSRVFFPEYSVVLLIVLLPSSAFFCLVIMIGVYNSHSSPWLFPMLVYFVLLASIHLPLALLDLFKSLSYFWVDTSLFEPLNPWSNSIWVVTLKCLNVHLCLYSGRTFNPTKSMLIPTQAKCNKRLACSFTATIE